MINVNEIAINKEKTVSFSGHRKLHKIIINNKEEVIKNYLRGFCRVLIQLGYDTFLTGGAEGFDWLAFDVVSELKSEYPNIKNILCIPYNQFDNKFQNKMALKFEMMLLHADEVIYVDEIRGYNNNPFNVGKPSKHKLFKRNDFLVDYSSFIIGCWDGSDSGTSNCISYAKI